MVKQTRIIFDLSEVVAVRLQCRACGDEVVQCVDRTVNAPFVCPSCGQSWAVPGKGLPSHALLAEMRYLVDRHGELPVVLRLELPGEPSD